jgi:hypothetical protein
LELTRILQLYRLFYGLTYRLAQGGDRLRLNFGYTWFNAFWDQRNVFFGLLLLDCDALLNSQLGKKIFLFRFIRFIRFISLINFIFVRRSKVIFLLVNFRWSNFRFGWAWDIFTLQRLEIGDKSSICSIWSCVWLLIRFWAYESYFTWLVGSVISIWGSACAISCVSTSWHVSSCGWVVFEGGLAVIILIEGRKITRRLDICCYWLFFGFSGRRRERLGLFHLECDGKRLFLCLVDQLLFDWFGTFSFRNYFFCFARYLILCFGLFQIGIKRSADVLVIICGFFVDLLIGSDLSDGLRTHFNC